ncbi:unnamed protein product [Medioppia subpectinata]|uniref:AMP-dependent synthetase/ligase domain-containing protein n=1 Tax=Medioppia subpectinata TaxID=1979941 RepID=A0A7R9L6C9_9ACAR|nr:unnamed protein product [Medioppia subpectinata]CAG2116161.1 unnamed protein product [Medioppia subpectinata]
MVKLLTKMTEPRILRSNIPVVDVPERSVGEYIWNKLSQLNEKSICLINAESNEQLTIGALKHRCQAVATALLAHGIARTDRLAFYGQNTIPHVVLRLATKLLGLPVCPLSPTFEAYEVDQECQSMGVTVAVCSASHLHKFSRLLQSDYKHNIRLVVVFDGHHDSHVTYDQLLVEGGDRALTKVPHFPVNPDVDPVILIHTSGSTGRPKCVMLKHKSILALLSERGHFLDPGTGTDHVIGAPYPMGHISGTSIIPLQLCLGARLVIYPDFDVELLFRSIERYKINFLPTFPSFGRKLVEGDLCDKYDLSSLRIVNTGGSPLAASISLAIIDKYGVGFREDNNSKSWNS